MPRRSGAAATLMPRIGAAPSAMLVVSLLLSWGLVNARVRAQEVQRIEMAPPGTDRIEPRNKVAYTAQATWLVRLATGIDLSAQAVSLLKAVRSSRTGLRADTVFNYHLNRAEGKM